MFVRLTFSTLAYNKQRDNSSYGHLIQTIDSFLNIFPITSGTG